MEEIWKDIPGYEGRYQASDKGRIKVLPYKLSRSDGTIAYRKEKILKAYTNKAKGGYLQVAIGSMRDGTRITKYVHSLVAETFLGERPAGYVVCHKNGDPADNRIENLRYDTVQHNTWDTYLLDRGSSQKISASDVQSIRNRVGTGESKFEIAKEYGVGFNAIWKIAKGKSFKGVD